MDVRRNQASLSADQRRALVSWLAVQLDPDGLIFRDSSFYGSAERGGAKNDAPGCPTSHDLELTHIPAPPRFGVQRHSIGSGVAHEQHPPGTYAAVSC
jgi:hypothetical protein